MADNAIDKLVIRVESNAQSASTSLEKLANNLTKVKSSLTNMNTSGLDALATSIGNLSTAAGNANSANNFARIANSLRTLSNIDPNQLKNVANSLDAFSRRFNNMSKIANGNQGINSMASFLRSIGNIGKIDTGNLDTKLQAITQSLVNMMQALNNAPSVSAQLATLMQSLAQLSQTTVATGNGFQMWQQAHPIINKLLVETGNLAKAIGTKLLNAVKMVGTALFNPFKMVGNFIQATTGKVFGLLLYINLVKRALSGIWGAVTKGAAYTEIYNYFNTTLTKMGNDLATKMGEEGADAGKQYVDGFKSELNDLTEKMTGFTVGDKGQLIDVDVPSLGLDPAKVMNFEAQIAQVTNSAGMLEQQSIQTAKALTMLSADFSSLRNMDFDKVMSNMTSGLLGQSRVMYQYGIDITNATLSQIALDHGITKSVSSMSQAEKMQLRLLAILQQSRVAWGDNIMTINSVANGYRVLKQQISNLGRTLGQVLMPIVSKVLPYVNAMIMALQKLFALLGVKLHGDNWLQNLNANNKGIGTGLEDAVDVADDLGDSLDGVGNSADGAKKAIDKLKTATLGIDELNIISPDDDTSSGGSGGSGGGSGGGGGGIDLSGDIGDLLAEYESVWDEALKVAQNKAEELANTFINFIKNGQYAAAGRWIANSLADSLAGINWDNVYEGARNFGSGLAKFLNGLLNPQMFYEIGSTISGGLMTAIEFGVAFTDDFDWEQLGLDWASFFNGILDNWDPEKSYTLINNVAEGLLTAFKAGIDNLNKEELKEKVKKFWEGLSIEAKLGLFTLILGKPILSFLGATTTFAAKTLLQNLIGGFITGGGTAGTAASAGGALAGASITIPIAIILLGTLGNILLDNSFYNDIDKKIDEVSNDIAQKRAKGQDTSKEEKQLKQYNNTKEGVQTGKESYYGMGGATGITGSGLKDLFHTLADPIAKSWNSGWDTYKNIKNGAYSTTTTKGTVETPTYKAQSSTERTMKEVTVVGKEDSTFTKMKERVDSVKDKVQTSTARGVEDKTFTGMLGKWNGFDNKTKTATGNGIEASSLTNMLSKWNGFSDKTKTATGNGSESTTLSSLLRKWANFYDIDGTATGYGKEDYTFSQIKSKYDNMKDKIVTVTVNALTNSANNVLNAFKANGGVYKNGSWSDIKYYAGGGLPSNGQMFVAREAGPELVGSIGNSTAVVNNSQIVESIASAIVRIVDPLMPFVRDSNATLHRIEAKEMSVNIGDREIAQANNRGQRGLGYSLQTIH